jgi:rhamnose utilization protein RhaD (predicted bifunctional aldolase and dehydrogenase)/NAD(P)-dependent dehydrogenase (short-subunit alcohol dehydrogenase family)
LIEELPDMRNHWDPAAAPDADDVLAGCVYGSRLLGSDPALVLHGGGNTSVKATVADITGEPQVVLYIKGSGWDLANITSAGFTPLRLSSVRRLLKLDRLDDAEMMNQLRCASLRADAPDPSVETLLHALLPYPAVQHSHADALLALTNQPDGEALVRDVFGDDVVVVPYVMPGFDLAKRTAHLFAGQAGPGTQGMVLLNHGLVTFGVDTNEAYRRHVDLVTRVEEYLVGQTRRPAATPRTVVAPHPDPLDLATLRRSISEAAGAPMVLSRHDDPHIRAFVDRPDLRTLAGRGPATPDHVIRTKRLPLIGCDVAAYVSMYQAYLDEHRDRARTALTPLDPAPRIVLDPAFGMLTVGRTARDAAIAYDIYAHTIDIIERAEAVGSYRALPAGDIFDVEYWELEQAKLGRSATPPEFAGEVALVTGAASGIGRACATALRARGAAVVGIDINPAVAADSDDYLGVQGDVTEPSTVDDAIERGVERFGGVDIVVPAAGIFPESHPLADLDPAAWRSTMSVNVDAIAYLFARVYPFLSLAPGGGRVVLIASKNVPAPGVGAAAYSVSKAAATQLARVAALEWAAAGIRVNVVHPDAVFDTGLWTDELIAERARHYGISVAQYKTRNLLHAEISSARVAALVVALCGDAFAVTTGAQIPVDGGNDRVI